MRQRCANPRNPDFCHYGARGISVCEDWRGSASFPVFLDWAKSHGWKPGLEIDRVDNSGGYSPGNCRFVPRGVNVCNVRQPKKANGLPTGVTRRGDRFIAQISFNGQKIHLGCFADVREASIVYKAARKNRETLSLEGCNGL